MKRILSIVTISLLTFTAGCSLNSKGAAEHSSLEKQNSLLKENSRLKAKQASLKSNTQTSKTESQSSSNSTQTSNTQSTNSDNSNADQASQDSRPADVPANYKEYSSYTTDGHKMVQWNDQGSYEGDPDAQYYTDTHMK